MLKTHDLAPAPGTKKAPRRVARGTAGKGGKTAGRGVKGQTTRSKVAVNFEGGQLPLLQRIPKNRGFNNPFRVEYLPINLDTLSDFAGDEVTPESLRAVGLIPKKGYVKVLGRGELKRKLNVSAHSFSKSAKETIESAGGTTTVLPLAHKVRPPAKGNQFANR